MHEQQEPKQQGELLKYLSTTKEAFVFEVPNPLAVMK
jgi:hypothetical protein